MILKDAVLAFETVSRMIAGGDHVVGCLKDFWDILTLLEVLMF